MDDRDAPLERHYRSLFDQAVDGIFFADPTGRYLDVNSAGARMLGYSRDEICSLCIGDIVAGEEAARIASHMVDLGAGMVLRTDWWFRRKDGSTFFAEVVSQRLADGCLLGIVRDATERRRVEAALRQSEERFRELADSMPQLVWIANSEMQVTYYNARAAEYGVIANQNDGYQWTPAVHPEDLEATIEAWREAVARGGDYEKEQRLLVSGGGYRWHLSRGHAQRDEKGVIVRWFGTATDIHDLKEAEAALREANRHKDEFLATLAHELRNPLAPIRSGLEFLKRTGVDSPKAAQVHDMMARQTDHLVRLVNDLLELSRLSQGLIEVRRETVDLAQVVNDAVAAARPTMADRRHRVTVSLPPEPLLLEADATRMTQVLVNLLTNAAKFTAPGGRIDISARAENGQVAVSVRDNGVGISAAALSRIFEPFVQIESGLDRSRDGLGLGLSLARRLVEMHEGRIEARSEGVGLGSEFIVRVPLANPPHAEDRHGAAVEDAREVLSRRILVVDDNHDVADSLAMLLESMGMDVRVAYDGPSALEIAFAFKPEIVFLDLGMPGMDGVETARRLRQIPDGNDAFLIALTGWGQAEHRSRTREAGFDEHLAKPVDLDTLMPILRRGRR